MHMAGSAGTVELEGMADFIELHSQRTCRAVDVDNFKQCLDRPFKDFAGFSRYLEEAK